MAKIFIERNKDRFTERLAIHCGGPEAINAHKKFNGKSGAKANVREHVTQALRQFSKSVLKPIVNFIPNLLYGLWTLA